MKFVALALAFLLSAGCQVQFIHADALYQYEQFRAAVVSHLYEAKESAQKAVANLDEAEFKDFKLFFNQVLDRIETDMNSAAESHAQFFENSGHLMFELLSFGREQFSHDLEELRKELEPKSAQLHAVVKKHLEEYRTLMEPALKEYSEKNHQVLEEFKTKFEPVVKELREKIKVNLEETKSQLTPMVEVIRTHLTKVLEELKTTFGPYAQEYREQIQSVIKNLQQKYTTGELQKELRNLHEKIKPHLQSIGDIVLKDVEHIMWYKSLPS